MKKTEKPAGELLNTTEAAKRLNLTRQQIGILIRQGKLPGQKVGRDWLINSNDLELAEKRPKRGRPRKTKSDDDEEDE